MLTTLILFALVVVPVATGTAAAAAAVILVAREWLEARAAYRPAPAVPYLPRHRRLPARGVAVR